MPSLEPSLTYRKQQEESTKPTEVSVKAQSADTWFGATRSRSGNCYYIQDTATSRGTSYASYAIRGGPCSGHQAGLIADNDWRPRW
jgi:hypothetical protein